MKVTAIIPDSGDRPVFLKHAVKQMESQTRKPDDVVIISSDKGITGNVRRGYERVKDGLVLIIENDDLYFKNYVSQMEMLAMCDDAQIFGCNKTIYYHIGVNKYREMTHPQRSSLFHTGIMAGQNINWPDDSEPFLDLKLWAQLKGELIEKPLAIGIKHGIGKCGGRAHKKKFWANEGIQDDFSYLSQFTNDIDFYKEMKKWSAQ